jgi:hypothetical protein
MNKALTIFRLSCLGLAVVALIGCTVAQSGKKRPSDITGTIQKGVTTRADIQGKLGPPLAEIPTFSSSTPEPKSDENGRSDTDLPTGTASIATYAHAQVNLSFPEGYSTTSERLWILYDEEGRVKDYGMEAAAIPEAARTSSSRSIEPLSSSP